MRALDEGMKGTDRTELLDHIKTALDQLETRRFHRHAHPALHLNAAGFVSILEA